MFHKKPFRIIVFLSLIVVLVLSSCAPLIQPISARGAIPTPLVNEVPGEVDNPTSFVDPTFFLPALLQALSSHDTGNLQKWMTDPFLVATWRSDQSKVSAADALDKLYAEQLGADIRLESVEGADLKALLGGIDPASIPGPDSGVMYAYLVSGWGKDGRDEAILFIAMTPADSLMWEGWLQIKGGFSGARLGGLQSYQSEALGFSVFVPSASEVAEATANEVFFMAPGTGHPSENRAAAFIMTEPAAGRTAEQVASKLAQETKDIMGSGYTGAAPKQMDIEGESAYYLGELPGQDINRRVFMVHNDVLYTLMFLPDNSNAPAYSQMEDLYAMVINTFHFTK